MARRCVGVVGLLSGLLILAGATTVVEAQTPKEGGSRAYSPTRRVPAGFGQVGLTTSQREEIYSIRAKYYEQIAELKRQLEEVEKKQSVDCAGVLTDSQRKLLETLRASRSKSEPSPAVKEAAEPATAAAPEVEAKPEAPKGEETQAKKGT